MDNNEIGKKKLIYYLYKKIERETGFEPATLSLGS